MKGKLRWNHRCGGDEIQNFASRYRLKKRVDEDGTKITPSKFGHLYVYDNGVLGVMVMPDPPRTHFWGHVRTAIFRAGFVVVQDCDGEGAATFDPTSPQQAEVVIRVAGIKRKRKISSQQREKQLAWLRASAGGVL